MRTFLLTLLLSFCWLVPTVQAFEYIDEDEVPGWAEEAVEEVREEGIMTGFGDGSFRPNGTLNRAQAVTLILRLKDLEEEAENIQGDLPFFDVPKGSWFYNGVKLAHDRGWIQGKSPIRFVPEQELNKAEWATMLVRAFDLELGDPENLSYNDVPHDAWFAPYVAAVKENDLVLFGHAPSFGPADLVSRADAAWVMAKVLGMPRLMGTSEDDDVRYGLSGSRRRVAVKPRDFNPNQQGYDIEKKGLNIKIEGEGDVILTSEPSYAKMGRFTVTNTVDDHSTFESIQLRLRFESETIGPEDEFEVKMVDLGTQEAWEMETNTRGNAVFTGLGKMIEPESSAEFEVFLRPKKDVFFFQKAGHGSFSIFKSGGITSRVFNSTGRVGKRYAPIDVENREFAKIYFDPTK